MTTAKLAPAWHADFWRGRRVFLTGHTGFKGGWLSLWLQSLGAQVTGYALQPDTQPNLFEAAKVADQMDSIIGDIRDAKAVQDAMQIGRPELVLHLAAQPLVRASYADPLATYETNVMGTAHVLQAARATPSVRAIVVVTTDKVYQSRDDDCAHTESDRLGGHDPYSSSKACSELVTASYRESFFPPHQYEQHGVALATARAGNVIGGGDWAGDRLVPDVVRAKVLHQELVLRNPHSVRPWQHVLEPLGGYLVLAHALLTQGPQAGRAWNFGPAHADARPVHDLVENLCGHWDMRWREQTDPLAPHESNCLRLDCSQALAQLGWQPRWNLATALERTRTWYDEFERSANARALCLSDLQHYLSS